MLAIARRLDLKHLLVAAVTTSCSRVVLALCQDPAVVEVPLVIASLSCLGSSSISRKSF